MVLLLTHLALACTFFKLLLLILSLTKQTADQNGVGGCREGWQGQRPTALQHQCFAEREMRHRDGVVMKQTADQNEGGRGGRGYREGWQGQPPIELQHQ